MNRFTRSLLCAAATAAIVPTIASAVPLYSENFDVDATANWTFNSSQASDTPNDNTNQEANVFFDYSTVGIPPAPGGVTTRGLKVEANVNDGTGTQAAVAMAPTGLVLPAEYILRAH